MSAAEKTLAGRVAAAIDGATGIPFLNYLSDEDLHGLANLYWALQLDIQNEWVRRKMMVDDEGIHNAFDANQWD